jgi:hypothetical protein
MCRVCEQQNKSPPDPKQSTYYDCTSSVTQRLKKLRRRHITSLKQDVTSLLDEAQLCERLDQDGVTWCKYCGLYGAVGLDRVDNNVGYTYDNVVPCCVLCNFIKADLNVQVFLSQACKISNIYRASL